MTTSVYIRDVTAAMCTVANLTLSRSVLCLHPSVRRASGAVSLPGVTTPLGGVDQFPSDMWMLVSHKSYGNDAHRKKANNYCFRYLKPCVLMCR